MSFAARAAATAVIAFAAGLAFAGAPASVDIAKFAFAPNEITVAPGTTVVWVNRDETPHQVADKAKTFVSTAMDTGDRFECTCTSEGDFAYFCTLHPFMTGVVHVRK